MGNNMTWGEIQSFLLRMLVVSQATLSLFALTLLFALPLGLLVYFIRMSRIAPFRWAAQLYILVMRGTPLMLQLIFFFYGIDWVIPRFNAAVLAFSLNYAAYFAEIYRGGIKSMPAGQYEAANVLGFSKPQTFFRIIFPQVIKRILPPMGNEFITLVKDTSLAQVIGVVEIFSLASKTTATTTSFIPVIIAGIFYLVMNAVVSTAFSFAEKKLNYYK